MAGSLAVDSWSLPKANAWTVTMMGENPSFRGFQSFAETITGGRNRIEVDETQRV
jgi:hypothetical protein